MKPADRYPAMNHLFNMYFGQDFDLFGDSIPEIVACFKRDCHSHYQNVLREIHAFRSEHPNDLAVAFEKTYLRAFSPEPEGYTTVSFLAEVERLLRE
ncbi:hypothetical protein LJ656_07380 [Paraburkholderia sp. MMS20-SJTR3]|uniref:CdiI immunity protein domain-containing protein n=1 Tax=Paraburkholderia sejongensis TaxID=2886946 RepID=A0ABS8JRD0_9BURK|nr:contact-dependent growth inhibition system immunity protein [Paraburkholderia sp. MMS20-SJTR3]MCC8392407.1 hypothetical protein [Paraburkholderia sp. MMS20-SJTR3]